MSRSTLALVWLVTLLAAVGAGAWFSRDDGKVRCQAAQVAPLVTAIQTHNLAAVAGHQVEAKAIAAESRQTAHTARLIGEVTVYAKTNPDPADCSLDPYRLYRWRAANRGATVDPAGQPDGSAAGDPSATEGRQSGGPDGEPYPGGWGVSPAAGAVPGPGGMADENGSGAESHGDSF